MKLYTPKRNTESKPVPFQAMQYGTDKEADEYVKHCYMGYNNEILKIPGDMMGTPKNAFYAVKTVNGWQKIEKGDFIVIKDDEVLLIPSAVFQLSFDEA